MKFDRWLSLPAALLLICSTALPSGAALTAQELDAKLPDNGAIEKLSKQIVGQSYIDSLQSAASNFRDYQCFCHLFTVKENKWKDFGGALLSFKQRQLLRAEIKSSDYRNGSVVVKQPDGKIRGKGGGGLSLVKMTLQPDSRTIKLPTGFSLVESDFISLFDALKQQLASGAELSVSPATNIPAFKEPVQVLILRNKTEGLVHVIYINPKTKIPLAWNTFTNGQSHALVFFDELDVNKGLSDDLFRL